MKKIVALLLISIFYIGQSNAKWNFGDAIIPANHNEFEGTNKPIGTNSYIRIKSVKHDKYFAIRWIRDAGGGEAYRLQADTINPDDPRTHFRVVKKGKGSINKGDSVFISSGVAEGKNLDSCNDYWRACTYQVRFNNKATGPWEQWIIEQDNDGTHYLKNVEISERHPRPDNVPHKISGYLCAQEQDGFHGMSDKTAWTHRIAWHAAKKDYDGSKLKIEKVKRLSSGHVRIKSVKHNAYFLAENIKDAGGATKLRLNAVGKPEEKYHPKFKLEIVSDNNKKTANKENDGSIGIKHMSSPNYLQSCAVAWCRDRVLFENRNFGDWEQWWIEGGYWDEENQILKDCVLHNKATNGYLNTYGAYHGLPDTVPWTQTGYQATAKLWNTYYLDKTITKHQKAELAKIRNRGSRDKAALQTNMMLDIESNQRYPDPKKYKEIEIVKVTPHRHVGKADVHSKNNIWFFDELNFYHWDGKDFKKFELPRNSGNVYAFSVARNNSPDFMRTWPEESLLTFSILSLLPS